MRCIVSKSGNVALCWAQNCSHLSAKLRQLSLLRNADCAQLITMATGQKQTRQSQQALAQLQVATGTVPTATTNEGNQLRGSVFAHMAKSVESLSGDLIIMGG